MSTPPPQGSYNPYPQQGGPPQYGQQQYGQQPYQGQPHAPYGVPGGQLRSSRPGATAASRPS